MVVVWLNEEAMVAVCAPMLDEAMIALDRFVHVSLHYRLAQAISMMKWRYQNFVILFAAIAQPSSHENLYKLCKFGESFDIA